MCGFFCVLWKKLIMGFVLEGMVFFDVVMDEDIEFWLNDWCLVFNFCFCFLNVVRVWVSCIFIWLEVGVGG